MVIEYLNGNFVIKPESSWEVEDLLRLLGKSFKVKDLEPCGNVGLLQEAQIQCKNCQHR